MVLTAIILAAPFSLPVQATAKSLKGMSTSFETEMNKAVTSVMNALCQAPETFGFKKEQLAESYIGSPFKILSEQMEKANNYTVYYPILYQDIITGVVTVICENGALYPSVANDWAYELNNLKDRDASYLLYNFEDKLYAVNNVDTICLTTNNETEDFIGQAILTRDNRDAVAVSFSKLKEKNESISFNKVSNLNVISEEFPIRLLNVKGVPQIDENGNWQNICWAASLAMVLNYEYDVMAATAYDVTDMCGFYGTANIYKTKSCLETIMSQSWLVNILGSRLVTSAINNRISEEEFVQQIGTHTAGHPMLFTCDTTYSGEYAHMVTAYGYIYSNGTINIAIMDPRASRAIKSDGSSTAYQDFTPKERLEGITKEGYSIVYGRLIQMVNSTITFEKATNSNVIYTWVNTMTFSKQPI